MLYEVITATVHAVEFMGATPVFIDAEPVSGNIDCVITSYSIHYTKLYENPA